MTYEENVEPLGPPQLERAIKELPDVQGCKVVIDRAGRVSEVHVVGSGSRQAKQLVRDIQTIAQAQFGINLDYRVVSVVQLGSTSIADVVDLPVAPPRAVMVRLTTSLEAATVSVEVELTRGGSNGTGQASGSAAVSARPRIAAEATIAAASRVTSDGATMTLADLAITLLGGQRVVLVGVNMRRDSNEELLVGSSLVRADDSEAVVRAVLDAVDRRLWR